MTPKKLWRWLAVVMIAHLQSLYFTELKSIEKFLLFRKNSKYRWYCACYRTGHKDGQNVWQSIGGQTVGSIWGHGAYIAPDWTADYLHRNLFFCLTNWPKRR
jgi:nitric oxide reductase subunit B